MENGFINASEIEEIKHEIKLEMEAGLEDVFTQHEIIADTNEELADVYQEIRYQEIKPTTETKTEKRVSFKFYPGGVMGNDKAVQRKIKIGQIGTEAFGNDSE